MDAHEQWVDPWDWRSRCAELAGSGARMLDFLAAVDLPDAGREGMGEGGQIEVLAHLVDPDRRMRHMVRTRVPRAAPVLDSLVGVFAGAGWHEREAHEMLGVRFAGNDDLRPLLTTGSSDLPLRRTTPLPARVVTPWPGTADPQQASHGGAGRAAARPRTRLRPPGTPEEWQA